MRTQQVRNLCWSIRGRDLVLIARAQSERRWKWWNIARTLSRFWDFVLGQGVPHGLASSGSGASREIEIVRHLNFQPLERSIADQRPPQDLCVGCGLCAIHCPGHLSRFATFSIMGDCWACNKIEGGAA
jgi:ferredoxin